MSPSLSAAAVALALATTALTTAPAMAQDRDEVALVQRVLAAAQPVSIRGNTEYCGTIGIDASGRLIASQPLRGGRDGCLPRDHPNAVEIYATYHTHAAFEVDADSEVPSVDDLVGVIEEGIDGYVATPGGRFWFVDGQRRAVRQLCGLKCLPSDPRFQPGVFGGIRNSYTLRELRRRDRALD